LLLRSQGVFFLGAANILLRTTGLQNFCSLVQLIGLTGARALLFAFSCWRLVNSVSALIRHYFSSTFRLSENSLLVLEPFRAQRLLSSSSTIRIVALEKLVGVGWRSARMRAEACRSIVVIEPVGLRGFPREPELI